MNSKGTGQLSQCLLSLDSFQGHLGSKCRIITLSHIDHITIPPPRLWQVKFHLIALSSFWGSVRVWPDGFRCPRCRHHEAWQIGQELYECKNCHFQTSVTAGTIFQDTRKPLQLWFRAIWYVTNQKQGVSALGLQRVLGLGSYRTAWTWLHKLRHAMVRPGRDRLSGIVEVDETYIGGKRPGKRGRGAAGKALVVVAAQEDDKHIRRIRLKQVPDASAKSLESAFQECMEPSTSVQGKAFLPPRSTGCSDRPYYWQEHQPRPA